MFERRLKILLIMPACTGLVILGRLFQLQVISGGENRSRAEAALVSPRRFLPPLRGRILDRYARTLVSDEPAYDVTVHFGALSMDPAYLHLLADGIRRAEPKWRSATAAELNAEVRTRVARLWTLLERASPTSLREFRERRDRICVSVERLRRYIWKARAAGGHTEDFSKVRLKEEGMFHAVLRDISPRVRTEIELNLSDLPFVRVDPSVRRVWHDGANPLCHLLGRLGQVSPEMIRDDPLSDDRLACYHAGDEVGVSGIERLGERTLRGKRGYEERFRDNSLKELATSVDGLDVQLTIDSALQHKIAEILRVAIVEHPPATGAACVVIDVQSREILALVSVPTYDGRTFRNNYASLRDDARNRPLLFRAVQVEYPPGSTIKPLSLLAALSHNLIDERQTITCDGVLIPGATKWHCWTHWRNMPGHGPMAAVDSIQQSCNIFYYTLGERLGAHRLTEFIQSAIRPTAVASSQRGTGLLAERPGLIPTSDLMRKRFGRGYRQADGRNYAIGQGELQLTPLQVANMFATLAAGSYRDPTLIANDGRPRPAVKIPNVTNEMWDLARLGLFRCVNEVGGTAYKWARVEDLEICGKTGSAQSVPRVVRRRYVFRKDGGGTVSATAPTLEAARALADVSNKVKPISRKIIETWPPRTADSHDYPTHAWFAGFAPYREPRIALAVIVEYGGGGGRTAGPLGREIFTALLNDTHEYLRPTPDRLVTSVP